MGRTGSGDVIKLPSSRNDETIVFDDGPSEAGVDDSLSGSQLRGPTKIGRYVVLDIIGVGGMGVVCTAYDPKLDRKVALKLLRRPGNKGSARASMGRARLLREAQALAKLSHPNIITVHDVDTTPDDRLYMAMEFVEGETLAQWLAARARTWKETLEVFGHAGRGLAAAHAAGITHRDFKPANVLIGDDGRVRVLDFGLAKNVEGDSGPNTDSQFDGEGEGEGEPDSEAGVADSDVRLTRAGRVVGTPAYMAPEQRRGKPVGPATDQFGFAVALFEGLYGFLPFRSDHNYLAARRGEITEPPRDIRVPGWVFRVLKQALSPKAEDRFPSMEGMLAALRADPAKKRRKASLWVGGTVTTVLAGFGLFSALSTDEAVCQGASERLDQTWNPIARENVQTALRATGTAYAEYTAGRVVETLDKYASDWSAARVEVCEATRVHAEQSESLMDTRMTCLDQRQGALRALVNVLADADEKVVERAVAAVHGLADPDACTVATPGSHNDLPTDPGQRERVLVVQSKIDEANALISAGRYSEAQATATAAASDAAATGHRPTQARAALFDGLAAYFARDYEAAEVKLSAAAVLGAEVGDRHIEARAWTKLIYVSGAGLHQPERGLAWLTAAEASLAALEDPGTLKVDLFTESASMLLANNQLEEAIEAFRSALEAIETGEGDTETLAYVPRSNLGIALARTGDFEGAESMLRKAMESAATVFGPRHPRVASVAQNLGNVLVVRKNLIEARVVLERALEIRVALFGAGHPRAVEVEVALATVDRDERKYGAAVERLDRAVASFRKAGKNRRVAQALNNLGAVHLAAGDPTLAHAAFAGARQLIKGGAASTPQQLAHTDQLLCDASLAASELARADEECSAARAAMEGVDPGPNHSRTLAEVQLLQAKIAVADERGPDALALAKLAVGSASAVEPPPKVLSEANALLLSLSASRSP